ERYTFLAGMSLLRMSGGGNFVVSQMFNDTQYENIKDESFQMAGMNDHRYSYGPGLSESVWLALPELNQPTKDSCYLGAVIFLALFNKCNFSLDFGLYSQLMKEGLVNKERMKDKINKAGSIVWVVGDLFNPDDLNGKLAPIRKDGIDLGVIGVRCLPRPKMMPENARKIEREAINGGNLKIVTNNEGEEWWSWPNGHALAVIDFFHSYRYSESELVLFDPMAGRLILEFKKNIENWLYPIGKRVLTKFISRTDDALDFFEWEGKHFGLNFEEHAQQVFGD
ncbi:MAG: hypothetical protein U9Q63_00505, partial [Patescibacteria group bacterium]|nr:hypothetical protein [Patescibacteria group bacterium]